MMGNILEIVVTDNDLMVIIIDSTKAKSDLCVLPCTYTMAGVYEDGVTLQIGNLPTDSVSFGRFELEQLPWERRSSFTHNRYLEEAEKYATPGSVSKKKEYFEAHFKKKAFHHQATEEFQNVSETIESAWGDNYRHMTDFGRQSSMGLVDFSFCDEKATIVTDQHEAVENEQEESSSAELPLEIRSLISKIDKEQVNGTPCSDGAPESEHSHKGSQQGDCNNCGIVEDSNSNVFHKQIAENRDALSKITSSVIEVSIQQKAENVSVKTSDAVDHKSGNLKMRAHLTIQQMSLKASGTGHSIAPGKTMAEKSNKKIRPRAKLEKQTAPKVSLVSSTENMNIKSLTSGIIQPKLRPEHDSEEDLRANASEVIPHKAVGKSGNVVRQSANRVKFIAKAEIKPASNVFTFKSSQRAEKRKEFNMKLEEKLHAKEAEMNERKSRSEVLKHAEIKLLRKSLNFKATPMPSFYHETALRVSEGKKDHTVPTRANSTNVWSKCSTPALQRSTPVSCFTNNANASDGAERNRRAEAKVVSSNSSKRLWNAKCEVKQGNDVGKEVERRPRRNTVMSSVKGIVNGRVAVHVAS
ncbi:hypothetical protein HPP92_004874 [Vanilla planifolia]|uniref:TPX2 C-terminal domain-containing protein n=1 Tax=Vanilla planifolia TaxID=51239 RepID=A0A835RMD5_VANPL|nr:hypothetical protein HPP92_004874 [Vanilla planifolia]